MMNPPGSFPGVRSFATAPTTRPIINAHRMCMATSDGTIFRFAGKHHRIHPRERQEQIAIDAGKPGAAVFGRAWIAALRTSTFPSPGSIFGEASPPRNDPKMLVGV